MKTRKKKKPRHTKAGRSILAGLKEIQEAYTGGADGLVGVRESS